MHDENIELQDALDKSKPELRLEKSKNVDDSDKEISSISGHWVVFGGNERYEYDNLSLAEVIWSHKDFMANGSCRMRDMYGNTHTLSWYCEYYDSADEVIWGAGGSFAIFSNIEQTGQLLLRVSVPNAAVSLRVLKKSPYGRNGLNINVGGRLSFS
jgi:hypothetical protein